MSSRPKGRWQDVEPWPEQVNGQLLLNALAHLLKSVVVLPKCAAEVLALWVVHTYAFHLRHVSTYIGIESPEKQCGKTTLLTVLSHLVNRPEIAANISPSAFFRVIEETRPTLLIDEGDTFLRRNAELRGILNAGYTEETAYVVRVSNQEDEHQSRLVRFSCFCPKAIVSIGRLPETLSDRCITIRMQRKTACETCERLHAPAAAELRRQCARFVLDHENEIMNSRPQMPSGLGDRVCDIFEPLTVLADLAGGDWPEMARNAAVELTASTRESHPIGSLLLDIFFLFGQTQAERMFSRTIVAGLKKFGERPWTDLRRGREIDEPWLARQLRPYGAIPRTLWIGAESARGYTLEDLEDLFKRYIPRSEIDALLAALRGASPAEKPSQPDPPPDAEAKKAEPGPNDGGEAAAA